MAPFLILLMLNAKGLNVPGNQQPKVAINFKGGKMYLISFRRIKKDCYDRGNDMFSGLEVCGDFANDTNNCCEKVCPKLQGLKKFKSKKVMKSGNY
jgi:hypothetical protein